MRRLIVAVVGALALVAGVVWYARKDSTDAVPVAPAASDPVQEEQVARAALRENQNDPRARLRLTRALRRLGRNREAESELLHAIQAGLPEAEAQREYVLVLAPQKWPTKMDGLFQRVLRDNPDDLELVSTVADSYAAKGLGARAEPLYTRLIARAPDDRDLRFKRGVARMRSGYFGTAVADFREVLSHDPGNYDARLFLAHSLLGDARMGEAEQELQACRLQRPDEVEPIIGLATCEIERNNLRKAELLLGRAAQLAGDSSLVLQEQATLYLRQQRTDLALATLKRLVNLYPDHRQGHLQLAQAYLAAGNAADAKRHEQIYQALDKKEESRLAAQRGMR